MNTYTATAVREGRWWVLTVDGIGAPQSRTLKAAPDAAAESRAAARELEGAGLTGSDIAYVLQVTPQRVSQLLAS